MEQLSLPFLSVLSQRQCLVLLLICEVNSFKEVADELLQECVAHTGCGSFAALYHPLDSRSGLWTDSAWPYSGQASQGVCWGETGVLGALPAWTQPGGLQCRHTTGAVGVSRGAAVLVGVGIDCPVMNAWWLLRS